MLIFGALIGFVVGLVLIGIPIGVGMAAQVGAISYAQPFVGAVLAWASVNVTVVVAVIIHFVVSVVSYLVGTIAVSTSGAVPRTGGIGRTPAGAAPASWEQWEYLARGVMIGTTAAVNWAVLPIFPAWLSQGFPPLFAVMLAAVPLLWFVATFVMLVNLATLNEGLCGSPWFEAVLGWTMWLMPSAFLINLIGVVLVIINAIAAIFGVSLRLQFEWWIGVWIVHGGLHPFSLGYNTGNFIFVNGVFAKTTPVDSPGNSSTAFWTADGILFHESGHTMNVGAFGSWWHLAGAVDQMIQVNKAFAETLAESHLHMSVKPWFPLWGVPGGVGATTANAPASATNVAITVGGLGFSLKNDAVPLAPGAVSIRPVYPAGSTASLSSTGLTDADGFPLSLADPGVNPAFTTLWTVTSTTPGSAAVAPASVNAGSTTALFATGGDYEVKFRVTDGMEGQLWLTSISVVEARANGPYRGTLPAGAGANVSIPLTAAGSNGGTAGVLPSVATGAAPALLTLVWSLVGTPPAGSHPSLSGNTAGSPTFTADVAGTYGVRLTVTTPGGVMHSNDTTVTIT